MTDGITYLNIRSDFTPRFDVDQYVAGTGWTSATGTSGWTIRVALTPTGSALGSLSATAAEEGSTGVFATTFDAADLTDALAAYVGQDAYVVISKSGDVDGKYKRVRVVEADEVA